MAGPSSIIELKGENNLLRNPQCFPLLWQLCLLQISAASSEMRYPGELVYELKAVLGLALQGVPGCKLNHNNILF